MVYPFKRAIVSELCMWYTQCTCTKSTSHNCRSGCLPYEVCLYLCTHMRNQHACSYYYKMNTPGPCDASCKAGLIDDLQTRLNNSPKNMKLPSGTTVDDVLRYRKAHKVC